MSSHMKVRIVGQNTLAFAAGAYLYRHGARSERDLLNSVASALRVHDQRESLQGAIQGGWLKIAGDGLIECSAFARAHYNQLEGKASEKTVGQITPAPERFNAYERPPLSKKYIPNSRGSRLDIPDWSVRPAGFGFKSVGGGDAKPMRFPGKEGQ